MTEVIQHNKECNDRLVDLTEDSDVNLSTLDNTDDGYVDKFAGRVTYTELHTLATELCRTVCNDQIIACQTYSNIKQWIDVLREKKN